MSEPFGVRQAIGQRLRRSRLALGFTLDDVVERLARDGITVSRSTLHRIETGRVPQPIETIAALCRATGLSLAALDETARAAGLRRSVDLGDATHETLMARGQQLGAAGRIADALHCFEAAHDILLLEQPAREERDALRARALIHVADCLRRLRCFGLALDAAGSALNLAHDSIDDQLRAIALHVSIGYMQEDRYRTDLFARHAEELLPRAGEPARAFALAVLANLHYKRGEHERARPRFEEAEALYRKLRLELPLARTQVAAGDNLFRLGRRARGVDLVHRGFHRARRGRFFEVMLHAQRILGRIEAARGRPADALYHLEQAAALARRLRLPHELFLAWHGRWEVLRESGEVDAARRARTVLRRLLRRVDPNLPEARRFAATLALEPGAPR